MYPRSPRQRKSTIKIWPPPLSLPAIPVAPSVPHAAAERPAGAVSADAAHSAAERRPPRGGAD